jgi:hypothetical protein
MQRKDAFSSVCVLAVLYCTVLSSFLQSDCRNLDKNIQVKYSTCAVRCVGLLQMYTFLRIAYSIIWVRDVSCSSARHETAHEQ